MPSSNDPRELVRFLSSCSHNSLGSFQLARFDQASQLEDAVGDLVRQLAEALAFAELAGLLRQHGEALIGASSAVRREWSHFGVGNLFGIPNASEKMLSPHDKLVLIIICIAVPFEHDYSSCLSYEHIGRLCSLSGEYVRSIIRDLIYRQILKRLGAGEISRFQYIVRPQSDWLDRAQSKPRPGKKGYEPKAKKAPRAVVRFNVGEKRTEVWRERCDFPTATIPESIRVRVERRSGELIQAIDPPPGPVEIRYPVAGNHPDTSTEVVAGNHLESKPEPKKVVPLVAGNHPRPSTEVVAGNHLESKPEPKKVVPLVAGNHPRPSTEVVAGNHLVPSAFEETVIKVFEGRIRVKHKPGFDPYTKHEEKTLHDKYGGAPRGKDLAIYLRAKTEVFDAVLQVDPTWQGWPSERPPAQPQKGGSAHVDHRRSRRTGGAVLATPGKYSGLG